VNPIEMAERKGGGPFQQLISRMNDDKLINEGLNSTFLPRIFDINMMQNFSIEKGTEGMYRYDQFYMISTPIRMQ
jgi:hypothetical protein